MRRTLSILLAAFAFGVLSFAVAGVAVGPVDPQGAENLAVIRWVALGLPLMELPMIALLWNQFGRRIEESEGWEARSAALRGRTIVIAAMFEGPALIAGVSFLLTGFNWQGLPALALFLAGIAMLFPTRGRIIKAIGLPDGRKGDEYS